MDKIDPEVARNVWQRVQGNAPRQMDLQGFLVGEMRLNAEYARLLRRPGLHAATLRQMQEESRLAVAVLQGICRLTGQNCRPKLPGQKKEELPETVLRRCYGQNLSLAKQYQGLTQDGEYGHAFSWLQQQKHRQCLALLQILGGGEK